MPLAPQSIDIPLLPINQKSPTSAGPVGRLQQIKNGVVQKIQNGQIRVQKRDGFAHLSQNIRLPSSGAATGAGGVPAPQLLSSASAGSRLVATDDSGLTYRYNDEQPCWELAEGQTYLPVSLQTKPLVSNNASMSMPDIAVVGNNRCYVWGQANTAATIPAVTVWAMVIDQFGVQVRAPFLVGTSSNGLGARVKVISDGTNFWIFSDIGTTALSVSVLTGSTGVTAATNTSFDTLNTAGNHWDIVYDSSVGVCFAAATSPTYGFKFTRLTVSGATISVAVQTSNFDIGPSQGIGGNIDAGLGFLRSDNGDGHVYIATVVSGDGKTIFAGRLNPDGTSAHVYTVISDSTTVVGIGAITGFANAAFSVFVCYTQYPQTAQPFRNSYVVTASCTIGGGGSAETLQRGSAVASRPIGVGGRYLIAVWYPSQLSEFLDVNAPWGTSSSQPGFFLYDIQSLQIVGSFLPEIAVFDYALFSWVAGTTTQPGPGFFMLPSVAQDGGIHLPLVTLFQRAEVTVNTGVDFVTNPLASVLITDVTFAGLPVRSTEYASETLLPGVAAIDEGDLSEQGFWLAPETPALSQQTIVAPEALIPGQTYQYIVVWECIDSRGDIVQSQLSVIISQLLTGTNNQFTLTLPTLRHTRHKVVYAAVYRSYINALGVMSTDHRLVFPLPVAPLNDPTVDTITIVDNTIDSSVAQGQPLYADPSATPVPLEYFAPPPWTVGDVFANRLFVVGADGSISFSMEKVAGKAIAFNPFLNITLPSAERIRSIAAMDSFLIIGCDASIWFIENSGFPDATGIGPIPTPVKLPFPNGTESIARATKDGVFYVSSSGGLWMIGRDLTNQYIGASIEDDAGEAEIVDIEIDGSQRVHFIDEAGQQDLVWDSVVQQWYTWTLPALPLLATTYQGQLVFADPTNIWQQEPETVVDNTTAIITTVPFSPFDFSGVPGLQMVWELQFLGQRLGRHTLTITVFYDDETQSTESFSSDSDSLAINFGAGQAYRFAIQPANPECQAIAITISDSFPLGATAGYTLENVGAEVGIIPGTRKIPIAQRIPG